MSKSLRPKFKLPVIQARLDKFTDERIQKVVDIFSFVGESFVNRCRLNGGYRDQTGNLRSSTGFVVFTGNKVENKNISTANKDDGGKGKSAAKALVSDVKGTETEKDNITLIGFAGMGYASAVEAKDKEVISTSALESEKELKELMKEL